MADLIDRDRLLKYIDGMSIEDTSNNLVFKTANTVLSMFKQVIKAIPKADTERHAHWIFQSETSSAFDKKYKCSKCNRVIVVFDEKDLIHYRYCHCGAKMDEVTGNE